MNGEYMEISLRWSPPQPALATKTRASPLPGGVLYFSNPSRSDRIRNSFAQCGHTQEKMDWLFEQLREPRVLNLNASQLSLAVSLAVKSM